MNIYEKFLRWKNDNLGRLHRVSGYELEFFKQATEGEIERVDKYIRNEIEQKWIIIVYLAFIGGVVLGALFTAGTILSNM